MGDGARQHKITLIATSYDPDTHAVKGILMPHEVETGWVPIATQGVGNGYGILMGPAVGTKDDLAGDQFDVSFEAGDHNTPVARHRLFSKNEKPPRVESGEVAVINKAGNKLFLDKDGNLTATGPTGQKNQVQLTNDGKIVKQVGDSGQFKITMDPTAGITIEFGGKKMTLDQSGRIKTDANLESQGSIYAAATIQSGAGLKAPVIASAPGSPPDADQG